MKNRRPDVEILPQYDEHDPNRPETEEDGKRAGQLRILKVRKQYEKLTVRPHGLLVLPTDNSE